MSKGRPRKPSCYLTKECVGWFLLDVIFEWIARDNWENVVARGKTKKECEKNAREYGYTPR